MKRIYQVDAKIIENIFIAKDYKLLTFKHEKLAASSRPGQFLTIQTDCFLRRPFSIASIKNKIKIIYKIVGAGTLYISNKKAGDKINIIGPLGNGISLPLKKDIVFIAGGSGIAMFYSIALKTTSRKNILFYGVKTKSDIVKLDIFPKKGWAINVATEDGSYGSCGTVVELFQKYIKNQNSNIVCYSAGPVRMLKQIADLSHAFGFELFVSLESIIACGVGACRGCVIPTKNGYRTVCKDGPVFNSREIIWDELC